MKKKYIVFSVLISLGFLLFSYWITNLRISISGESALLSEIELWRASIYPYKTEVNDSVVFVNVEYDKELRPVRDEYGIPAGHSLITNRQKLIKLLQHLKKEDNYRFILLDIFFGDDFKTEYDQELYALIESMPRIVIPNHADESIADKKLLRKAGLADYATTYFKTSFIKYPFLNDTLKSIPVKMYEEITHRSIRKYGPFYFDGLRLARNSIVLTFNLQANSTYDSNGEKIWYNMGMDLLDDSIPEFNAHGDGLLYTNPDLTNDKYIVIGAFDEIDDSHSTFAGMAAGSVINFNAFISLMNNHHIVSIILILILFVVFFVMSYLILTGFSFKELLHITFGTPKDKRLGVVLKALSFAETWISYSLIMSLICIFTYFALGEVYDIIITSTLFTILNIIVKYYKRLKSK